MKITITCDCGNEEEFETNDYNDFDLDESNRYEFDVFRGIMSGKCLKCGNEFYYGKG